MSTTAGASRVPILGASAATQAPGASIVGVALASVALTLALLAYCWLALGYATRTPLWQNPDEPAHYNYVAQVADSGTLPTLQMGDWDSQLLERLKTGRLEPTDSITTIRYEGWQPPLFYLLAAPILRLEPGATVEQQVRLLRLLDVVLGALTLLVAFVAARQVLPVGLAVAVPLVMVGVPMFTAVAGGLSADPLANLLAAVLVWQLLRSLHAGPPAGRWALGMGVLVGLGVLCKLALVIFAALALALIVARSERRLRNTAMLLGALGLVLMPWLVHQVTSYGWTDPLATQRHAAVVFDQPRFPGFSVAYLASFAAITFHSFWAQFGWMAILAPQWLYWTWGGFTLLALGGLVRQATTLRGGVQPGWLVLCGTLAAAWLAYVAYNLMFQQPQGRYLFTALVPLATLMVVGWAAWLPRRLHAPGTLLLAAVLLGLNAYALLRVLEPGFL